MSVFDLPRLHFGGVAVTRLPTGTRSGLVDLATHQALTEEGPFPTNRPPKEYHDYLEQWGPRFDGDGRVRPDGMFSAGKGTNFGGNGHFWIDAQILSVEHADGTDVADPVVGRAVDMWGHYNEYLATTVNRARVFDVDPTSHVTTTLMVGQFCFGRMGRSHDSGYMMVGDVAGMHPPRWHNDDYVLDGPDDDGAGGLGLLPQLRRSVVHQFVVDGGAGLKWLPEAFASPAVRQLQAVLDSGDADGLVVQFALTTMAAPTACDMPDRWCLRGTIAPWRQSELRTYPAGRLLTPPDPGRPSLLHVASVAVDPDRVTLNMITGVPLESASPGSGSSDTGRTAPPQHLYRVDVGDLQLRTAVGGHLVATVPADTYRGKAFDQTSGIVTVPAQEAWTAAQEEALVLVGSVDGQPVVLLREQEINIQSDDASLFLDHPDRIRGEDHAVEVSFRSFVRGRPAPVNDVRIHQLLNPRSRPLDPDVVHGRCEQVDFVQVRPGRAHDGGDYASEHLVSTNDQGWGWITVRGSRAGAGRLLLSSPPHHVSRLPGAPGTVVRPGEAGEAGEAGEHADDVGRWSAAGALAVRVLPDDWHLDDIHGAEVTFDLVYREVFAYYELLYSFMNAEVFSLADRCKTETYARLIWQMSDPRNKSRTYYMPPTRDLSQAKAGLLLKYLRNQQAVQGVPTLLPACPSASPREITSRRQLWMALKDAAGVELAVMLQYLFAAYSIPTHAACKEFVRHGHWTSAQAELVSGDGGESLDGGLRGSLLNVAREEMIHFLIVNNIIMGMGESFHVPVIDFGRAEASPPFPLDFSLEPFGIGSLQRFIAIEAPRDLAEGWTIRPSGDLTGDARPEAARPGDAAEPPYGSISDLYASIRDGLHRVPDVFMVSKGRGGGEHHLFLRESINAIHPDYELRVDDLSSALFALDVVTEQGEGRQCDPSAPAGESHFDTFLRVSRLLMSEQLGHPEQGGRPAQGPAPRRGRPWNPAYPVLRNPSLGSAKPHRQQVSDEQARQVMRLFNRSYFMMFQLMVQHFGWQPDTTLRRSKLMNAAIDVMTGMMSPLAELLVTLPSGVPGHTAGPSFELEDFPGYVPRPDLAMANVSLRFDHLARDAARCDVVPDRVGQMYAFYTDFFHQLALETPAGPRT